MEEIKKESAKEGTSEPKINENGKVQERAHNKALRTILLVIGGIIILFLCWMAISYFQTTFDYNGVNFRVVDEIAPYRTSLPVTTSNGKITGNVVNEQPFYFYLRKDPRKTGEIPFNGSLVFLKTVVMNSTGDIMCGGMGVVGTVNLANLYTILGAKVVKDPNASCDDDGRFMFIQIEKGNETRIDQVGNACYTLTLKDCEILEVTERFMLEIFKQVKEITG